VAVANLLQTIITAQNNSRAALVETRAQILSIGEAATAASPQLAGMTAHLSSLASAAGAMATPVGMLATLAAAGVTAGIAMTKMGLTLSDTVEQLRRQSEVTGVSIQQLQVLRQSLENLGGSGDDVNRSLAFLGRNIAQGNPLLAQLGITTRNVYEAFLQLSDKIGGMTDQATKNYVAMTLLGRGGYENLAIFKDLRSEVEHTGEVMAETGGIFSDVALNRAAELDRATDDLRTQWNALRTQMAELSLPTAAAVIAGLHEILEAARRLKDQFDQPPEDQGWVVKTIKKLGEAGKASGALVSNIIEIKERTEDAAISFNRMAGNAVAAMQAAAGIQPSDDWIGPGEHRKETREEHQRRLLAPSLNKPVKSYGPGVLVGPPEPSPKISIKTTELSEHERMVRSLAEAWSISKREAEGYVIEFERLSAQSHAVESITRMLMVGPEVPESVRKVTEKAQDLAAALGISQTRAFELAESLARAKHEDEAARAISETDPGLAERADDARRLDIALGASTESARELWLELLHVRDSASAMSGSSFVLELSDQLTALREKLQRQSALDQLRPLLDQPGLSPGARQELATAIRSEDLEKFTSMLAEITDSVNRFRDTMGGLWQGLQSGFQAAFSGLLTGAMSFATAFQRIIANMVQAVLGELAKLAAAAVFKLILSLFGGVPAVVRDLSGGNGFIGPTSARPSLPGIDSLRPTQVLADLSNTAASVRSFGSPVAGQPARSFASAPTLPAALTPYQRPQLPDFIPQPRQATSAPKTEPVTEFGGAGNAKRPEKRTGNTYVINALDARDVLLQLLSPGGAFRTARDQIAFGEEY
jgi:hypothetical protein